MTTHDPIAELVSELDRRYMARRDPTSPAVQLQRDESLTAAIRAVVGVPATKPPPTARELAERLMASTQCAWLCTEHRNEWIDRTLKELENP